MFYVIVSTNIVVISALGLAATATAFVLPFMRNITVAVLLVPVCAFVVLFAVNLIRDFKKQDFKKESVELSPAGGVFVVILVSFFLLPGLLLFATLGDVLSVTMSPSKCKTTRQLLPVEDVFLSAVSKASEYDRMIVRPVGKVVIVDRDKNCVDWRTQLRVDDRFFPNDLQEVTTIAAYSHKKRTVGYWRQKLTTGDGRFLGPASQHSLVVDFIDAKSGTTFDRRTFTGTSPSSSSGSARVEDVPQPSEILSVLREVGLRVRGSHSSEYRTWTEVAGERHEDYQFGQYMFGEVTLSRIPNEEVRVPLDKLSEPDREYLCSVYPDVFKAHRFYLADRRRLEL